MIGCLLILTAPALAQYTADFQTNIISNVTSNWPGSYYVGYTNFADVLLIQNGGVLVTGSEDAGYVGYNASSSNNSVVVTGSGSVWNSSDNLFVGYSGAGNSLVISNGGQVFGGPGGGWVGLYGSSNSVLVTGTDSVWKRIVDLYIGVYGAGNSLVISTGGRVLSDGGYVGCSSSNSVLVTGPGSVWSNDYELVVGDGGSGNSLVISDGGRAFSGYGFVGYGDDSSVLVTGPGSVWSNGYELVVGDSGAGNSLVISNGGQVVSGYGFVGYEGNNNSVLVTGTGSAWTNQGTLYVGYDSSSNLLAIAAAGSVVTTNLFISYSDPYWYGIASNNVVRVDGGSLVVTNAAGNASLVVGQPDGKGELILNSGTVTADALMATNGANSVVTFNGGTLTNKVSTTIANGAVLQVALGTNSHPAVVNSNLTLGGTLNITDAGGFTTNTYTLFTYGGALAYNGLTIGTTPNTNFAYAIYLNTTGQVNLVVSSSPPPPVAGFTGSPTNGVAPLTVAFTDSSSGTITNRFWDFGDGNTTNTTATSVTNTYNVGTYTVSLTVSGPGGSDTSTRTNYIVARPCVAAFSGSPTIGPAPLTVAFTDSSSGSITNRFWDFGDSNTTNTTATSLTNTYNAGTYTVSLTVSGPGGSDASTRTDYIVVTNPPPPVAGFTGSPTNGPAPLTVAFTDSSSGTITNRSWDFGDGNTTNTTATSLTNTYNAGTYTVSLTVSGPGGSDTSTRTDYIVVTNPPLVVTNVWVSATGGKWETAVNWSAGAPSSNQAALCIANANSKTVTIDATTTNTPSTLTISNLTVSAPGGSTNTLFLDNAGTGTPLSVFNTLVIETNGSVAVNRSVVQTRGSFLVGNAGGNSALVITNGGAVYNGYGYVGYEVNSSNNSVLVSGTGSVWTNSGDLYNSSDLYVGYSGAGNSLVISDGGQVVNGGYNVECDCHGYGCVGYNSSSISNSVLVTGTGSVWNSGDLFVGDSGAGNSLVISNGGHVVSGYGFVGYGDDFSGSNNSVVVTGTGSVWNSGGLCIGNDGVGNSLVISDGGHVVNWEGYVGGSDWPDWWDSGSSSNNSVVVTGTGSVWNSGGLCIGNDGVGNSLVISNGGQVVNWSGCVGYEASSNSVLVTGPGSVWSNDYELVVGDSGAGNSLVISNGGQVYSGYGYVGYEGNSNSVLVTGPGSVWTNQGTLYVGYDSSSNLLAITNGSVLASNLFISYSDPGYGIASNNLVRVDGGSLVVTNAAGNASLVVGHGGGKAELILNGGTVTVDALVATNGAVLQFALGINSHPAVVNSNLTLGGMLNITDGGGFSTNTYTLFTYGGALAYNGLAIGTTPNTNFAYAIDLSTTGQVNLVVSSSPLPPVAGFSGSPTNGVALLTVMFTDGSSGGTITNRSWDFGDGNTLDTTATSVTNTYNAGTYTVSLTVSGPGGSDTSTRTNYIVATTLDQAITAAITEAITWLVSQQNSDGSWGNSARVARTGFAVVKLEERAFELGYASPFDDAYPYKTNVVKGLNYILSQARTYGPGTGICFGGYETYETGIAMMAIAASRAPDRIVNVPGSIVNNMTYKQVLQACVDYFASSQNPNGGWGYSKGAGCDNSNSGYAVLGLRYAKAFGCVMPAALEVKLNNWINAIQDHSGGLDDGGSWYSTSGSGANLLRTGNLLSEMSFVGDCASVPRVTNAVAYIQRHWNDNNENPGWRPHNYQAMCCLMNGFGSFGIDTITVGGSNVDWFAEFASAIVASQQTNGSWPADGNGDAMLSTEWALLVLEKAAPRPPASLTWAGDGATNNWDTAISRNWLNGVTHDYFYPRDSVTFSDSGSTNPPVNLVCTLIPASVLVDATVDYTFSGSGAIGGPGGLTKANSGTLTILTGNSYAGPTTVSNGTLLVNNTAGSGTGTGAVTVVSGATLGGTGTIGGPVAVNGTLAPGNGVGTLTISNSLVISGGAVLQYELGPNSDLTAVSGNLTLGGTLNITDAGGFTNSTYRLFTYGGALTYDGLIIGTTPTANFGYMIDTSTPGQVNLAAVTNPAPPVAAFSGSPTNGVAALAVTFTDSSSGSITNRFWNFGDGNTLNATVIHPVHTYSNAGTYTVSLTISGPGGSDTSTRTNYIVVTNPPPPVAGFSGNPTNGLAPLAVTFTDSSTGSISNRFWDFGDGNTTNTTATSLSHTYNAGTYTVSLTVSGYGGSDTSTRTNYVVVTNPPPPVAGFSGSPTNGVAPLAVTFADSSTGSITNWFWNFGDGNTTNTTATSLSHTYNAGTYTVSLTVSGPGGNDTSTRTDYIVATNPPLGVTNVWVSATGGKWETATNWSAGAPSSNQAALCITNANSKTVKIDATTTNTPSTLTISNLTVSAPGGSINTLFLDNAGTGTPLSVFNTLAIDTDGSVAVNRSVVQTRGSLFVGNAGGFSALVITNGGAVSNDSGYVGYNSSSISNSVLVSGTGSVWNSGYELDIGVSGAGNSLVISNGGQVVNDSGYVGYNSSSISNSVLVSGTGSVWNSGYELDVGDSGAGNSLVVSNGGRVLSDGGYVGAWFGNDNSVLVTGLGSVWSNDYELVVGDSGAGNSLVINKGGQVLNGYGYVGYANSSNSVLVSGTGSVWNSGYELDVGDSGAGNSLVISTGGQVLNGYGYVGAWFGNDNSVLVTGLGSVWSNGYELVVGYDGSGNSLVISNGGQVFNGGGYIGFEYNSSNNSMRVGGGGSVWRNQGTLIVGYGGSSNLLAITAGSVLAANLFISYSDPYYGIASNNLVRVDGGSLVVTNAAGNASLVVGRAGGKAELILNCGTVTADALVATNGANSVVTFNGGTLTNKVSTTIANGAVLQFALGTNSPSAVTSNLTLGGTLNITDAGGFGPGHYTLFTYGGTLTGSGLMIGTKPDPSLTYTIDTNTVGSVILHVAASDLYTAWRYHYFPGDGSSALGTADPDGDGMSNTNEFLVGFNPTNSAAYLHIISVATTGMDMQVTYLGADGDNMWSPGVTSRTNVLEFTTGTADGSYTNNFVSANQTNILSGGTGLGTVASFVDTNGASGTSRYYRVRVLAP